MNQTLDILSGPVERLADRRLDHGHHRARRWTQDRRDRRNDVDRVERQNRGVFVIEDSVVTGGVVGERVCGEVPVYEERLVAVVLLFVDVLRRDYAAVKAALTLSWSNGPVEGHINRLKLIKRSGYGRMQLALLRQRVLYEAA